VAAAAILAAPDFEGASTGNILERLIAFPSRLE
jgi:hypothetical protein